MTGWQVTAKELADEIWSGNQRVDLLNAIECKLQEKGYDTSTYGMANLFVSLRKKVLIYLQDKMDDYLARGITPRYRFSAVDSDILIPEINQELDSTRKEVAEAISSLSWRAFEYFCAHVLLMNAVGDCEVLRGTKDEGIDLVGMVALHQLSGSPIWYGMRLRIVGQAKTDEVSEATVRQFYTDIGSFAKGTGKAYELVPNRFRSSDLPVAGIIMTSQRYTRGAKTWADGHNITLKDLEQLTEGLITSSPPDLEPPGLHKFDNKVIFEKQAFVSYFQGLAAKLDASKKSDGA